MNQTDATIEARNREIYDRMDELGRITWHCTEEDGPPDAGISLGLGNGRILWAGEITRQRWLDGGEELAALGNDLGVWLILYEKEKTTVLGKLANEYDIRELLERLSAILTPSC